MKSIFTATLLLALSQTTFARQNIQQGEEAGIPERADADKKVITSPKDQMAKKKDVRQNQEETDPVFYDSTTSPKEMEQKKTTSP